MIQLDLHVRHSRGYYGPDRFGSPELAWHEPISHIFVQGQERVRIEGDGFELTAKWIDDAWLPADVSDETPRGITHEQAVEHWTIQLAQIEARRNVHVVLQAADIFVDATDRQVA